MQAVKKEGKQHQHEERRAARFSEYQQRIQKQEELKNLFKNHIVEVSSAVSPAGQGYSVTIYCRKADDDLLLTEAEVREIATALNGGAAKSE